MEKLLTAEELSAALGVKLSTIYSWSHKKVVPRAQNIRLLRFRESEVLEWLAKKPGEKSEKKQTISKIKQKYRLTGKGHDNVDDIVRMAKKEVVR